VNLFTATEQSTKGYAEMNPKIVIKTENLRMVGYRSIKKVEGREPTPQELEDIFDGSQLKLAQCDNFLGKYEVIADTFDIISCPWIIGEILQEWERNLLTSPKEGGTVKLPEGKYWLEEVK